MKKTMQKLLSWLLSISIILITVSTMTVPVMAATNTLNTSTNGTNWAWDADSQTLTLNAGTIIDTFILPDGAYIKVNGEVTMNYATNSTTAISSTGMIAIVGVNENGGDKLNINMNGVATTTTNANRAISGGVSFRDVEVNINASADIYSRCIDFGSKELYILNGANLTITTQASGIVGSGVGSKLYLRGGTLNINQNGVAGKTQHALSSLSLILDSGNLKGTSLNGRGGNSGAADQEGPRIFKLYSGSTFSLTGTLDTSVTRSTSWEIYPGKGSATLQTDADVNTYLGGNYGTTDVNITILPRYAETGGTRGALDFTTMETISNGNSYNFGPGTTTAGFYDWNKDTKILKLQNFTYASADADAIIVPDGTTIECIGENTITALYHDPMSRLDSSGIKSNGKVTFVGNSTSKLTVIADGKSTSYGINANIIKFDSGTLTSVGMTAALSTGATMDHDKWAGNMSSNTDGTSSSVYNNTTYSNTSHKWINLSSIQDTNPSISLDFDAMKSLVPNIDDVITGSDWAYCSSAYHTDGNFGTYTMKKTDTDKYEITLENIIVNTSAKDGIIFPANTTLILKGDNKALTTYIATANVANSAGVLAKGNLTIQGDGSLTARQEKKWSYSSSNNLTRVNTSGIFVESGTLKIISGTVDASCGGIGYTASGTQNSSLFASAGIIGGTVVKDDTYGVSVSNFNIEVTGGTLNGTSGAITKTSGSSVSINAGIAANNITISKGTMNGVSNGTAMGLGFGISATNITSTGGKIYAKYNYNSSSSGTYYGAISVSNSISFPSGKGSVYAAASGAVSMAIVGNVIVSLGASPYIYTTATYQNGFSGTWTMNNTTLPFRYSTSTDTSFISSGVPSIGLSGTGNASTMNMDLTPYSNYKTIQIGTLPSASGLDLSDPTSLSLPLNTTIEDYCGKGDGSFIFVKNEDSEYTLTLTDVNLTTTDLVALKVPANTTIILNGENTFTASKDSVGSYGISALGNLTIKSGSNPLNGLETLKALGGEQGINAVGNLILHDDVVVTGEGTGNQNNQKGIYASKIALVSKAAKLIGKVKTTGTYVGNYVAIQFFGGSSIYQDESTSTPIYPSDGGLIIGNAGGANETGTINNRVAVLKSNPSTYLKYAEITRGKNTANITSAGTLQIKSGSDIKYSSSTTGNVAGNTTYGSDVFTITGAPYFSGTDGSNSPIFNYTWYVKNSSDGYDLVGNLAPTDAGEYKLVVDVAPSDVNYKSGTALEILFTIVQKELTVNINYTGVTGKEYDGTTTLSGTPVITLSSNVAGETPTLKTGTTFAFSDSNVGNNKSIVVSGLQLDDSNAVNKNYSLQGVSNNSMTFTNSGLSITRADLSINSITLNSKTFDGTNSATVASVTFNKGSMTSADYDATASYNSVNANTGSVNGTATITLKGTAASNYNLTNGTGFVATGSITKNTTTTITATDGNSATFFKSKTSAQTLDLNDLVLSVTDAGNCTYTLGTFVDSSGILTAKPTLSDKVLNFTGTGATGTATLVVTVGSENYADFNVVITFTSAEKTNVDSKITFDSGVPTSVTYNESSQSYNAGLFEGLSSVNITYSYVGINGTSYGPSATAPTNAGTYTVTATYEDETQKGSKSTTFTITKATPNASLYSDLTSHSFAATFGQMLSDVTLPTGVNGTFAWKEVASTTSVGSVGSQTHVVVFAPTNTSYESVEVPVTITVAAKSASGLTINITGSKGYNDGEAVEPTITVIDGSTDLTKDTDYTVSYTGGTTVGSTVTITVTGLGNYDSSTSKTEDFQIVKGTGLANSETISPMIYSANTSLNTFDLDSITFNKSNPGNRTYTLSTFIDNSNILSAQPILSGNSINYTGTGATSGTATLVVTVSSENYVDFDLTITFTASDKENVDNRITFNTQIPNTFTYDDTAHSYETSLFDGVASSNFTYTYEGTGGTSYGPSTDAPVLAGSYTVTAKYEDATRRGSKTTTFTIMKATPGSSLYQDVSGYYFIATYGQMLSDVIMPTSTTGTVAWKQTAATTSVGNAGEQTHILVFTPNNTNFTQVEIPVIINVSPKHVTNLTITVDGSKGYNDGLDIEPSIIVKDGSTILNKDRDYTVSYSGGTTVGSTVTITVRGKGNYEIGTTKTENFQIVKGTGLTANNTTIPAIYSANQNLNTFNLNDITFNKNILGSRSYSLGNFSGDTQILTGIPTLNGTTISYTGTGAASGIATLEVVVTSDNYENTTVLLSFIASDKVLVNNSIVFDNSAANAYAYNGLAQTYEVANFDAITASGNATIIYTYTTIDGTLDGNGKPKGPGTYIVTVSYEDDAQIGTASATFTIDKATPSTTDVSFTIPTNHKFTGNVLSGIGAVNANSNVAGMGNIVVEYEVDSQWTTIPPTNAGSYAVRANVADGTNYKASYVNLGNYVVGKAEGTTVNVVANVSDKTHNSVNITSGTLNDTGTGQTQLEYAISTDGMTAPNSGWTTNLSFSGLSANTTYYIWTRAAANDNYAAGVASVGSLFITNVEPNNNPQNDNNLPAPTPTPISKTINQPSVTQRTSLPESQENAQTTEPTQTVQPTPQTTSETTPQSTSESNLPSESNNGSFMNFVWVLISIILVILFIFFILVYREKEKEKETIE